MSSAVFTTAITGATSVRVTRAGKFDPRRRTTPLLVASDSAALEHLRRCLAVDDQSFAEELALMTPGVLDFNFLVGHELLATASYLYPGFIRWRGWTSDARLVSPAELVAWLVDRGWRAPPQ